MLFRLWSVPLTLLLLAGAADAQIGQHVRVPESTPKIRTVTAFVRLDRTGYRDQVASAVRMLRVAREEFTAAGYEVETIRIATQPFPQVARGLTAAQSLSFFKEFDRLAQQEGFDSDIGPAMLRDSDDPNQAELLGEIIANTQTINGFVVVADAAGIHWNGIHAAARVNKYLQEHTDHGEGNFRFAAGAFPPLHGPFFPVTYTQGAGRSFAVGIESAGVVNQAFSGANGDVLAAGDKLVQMLGAEARKVEEIARRAEKMTGWTYQGIDLTPVPLKDVSIGGAIETLLDGPIGSPGSLSAAFTITSALQRIPVIHAGYSGLMLPVLEDSVLARRWEAGRINRDALLSYSAVCSAGLDAIPMSGETTPQELENIIADVASLSVKWKKPLSARLLPAPGKRVGEMTDFTSRYLVNIRIR